MSHDVARLLHQAESVVWAVMRVVAVGLWIAERDVEAVVVLDTGEGGLISWAKGVRRRARPVPQHGHGGVRFAFYGRTSTVEYQDPVSSAAWQREAAEGVIAGRGRIVAEFFDIGHSRRVSWRARPQARALLEAVQGPDRGFDAIVVGEFERAFAGDEFERLAPLFQRCGVEVWLPETNGPVVAGSVLHRVLVTVLGAQSQREVLRARHRVLGAMRAQVVEQGRYLGGRPPYGYQLADAGPHPNRATARWGRRLHRLTPDPETAPYVRWMFAQRLTGRSIAGIARELNERGVPCPSNADRARNTHRTTTGWTLGSAASILANPRYTGRQVWNRQSTDHDQHTPDRQRRPAYRWNTPKEWVFSKKHAHPALVSEDDFLAVQGMRAARPNDTGQGREYRLSSLVRCGLCGRRMDSHWVHDRAGYRCRHGHTTSKQRPPDIPKILYVREDTLVAGIVAILPKQGISEPLSPDDAIAHLRAGKTLVTYRPNGCTLEPDTDAYGHEQRSSSPTYELDLVW